MTIRLSYPIARRAIPATVLLDNVPGSSPPLSRVSGASYQKSRSEPLCKLVYVCLQRPSSVCIKIDIALEGFLLLKCVIGVYDRLLYVGLPDNFPHDVGVGVRKCV